MQNYKSKCECHFYTIKGFYFLHVTSFSVHFLCKKETQSLT